MKIEKVIASSLNICSIVLAIVFLAAIILGFSGFSSAADIFAGIGVLTAIVIPPAVIAFLMVMLFKRGEIKYGIYAVLLLIIFTIAMLWRLNA